jgi:outer membrane protein assembly factor BamE
MRYDRGMRIIAEMTTEVESRQGCASPSPLPTVSPAPRQAPQEPDARPHRPPGRACAAGLTALLSSAVLAACVYHMPIRQGNYLDPEAVGQVKPGMTHSQVRFLLGTPMVPEAFDNSRWDYDYYLDEGRLKREQHAHVTVYFTGNAVARVVSDVRSAPVTTITRGGVKYPVPF